MIYTIRAPGSVRKSDTEDALRTPGKKTENLPGTPRKELPGDAQRK
jgi:hypothetical protein